jgi:hypothetical protein
VKQRETTMAQNSSAILEILRTHVPGVHFTASGYLLLHAVFVQVMHFLVGKGSDYLGILFAVSNVCDVEFCDVDKATGIPEH